MHVALCSEVSQAVIESVPQAIHWIRSTYFYIR